MFVIGIIGTIGLLSAQTTSNPTTPLSFDVHTWNFGEIDEASGKVSHTFTYTNTSHRPIVIEHVKMSCGCTTASYSKAPLLPGRTEEMVITFDPTKQPGRFHKTIQITTDKGKALYNIHLTGQVNPRILKVDEQYPYRLSPKGLQLDAVKAKLGYVYPEKGQKKIIHLINTSEKEIFLQIKSIGTNSGKLKIDYPTTLKSNEKGMLVLSYPYKRSEQYYGTMTDTLEVSVKGVKQTQLIQVSGIAVEETDKSKKIHPQFRYQPSMVNFGNKTSNEPCSATIQLYNDGKAPLIIRKVECTPGCTIDLDKGTIIGPGKQKSITLRFTPPSHLKGNQTGGISIITNDPNRPLREIRYKINIK